HQTSSTRFCRTSFCCAAKYRIVDSMSLWPKNRCTDFRSIPFCSIRVAAVARNLWSHQLAGANPARLAITLQQSRKFNFGLHPAVGNTKPQVLSDLLLNSFNSCVNFLGIGICRSRYVFGENPYSGL